MREREWRRESVVECGKGVGVGRKVKRQVESDGGIERIGAANIGSIERKVTGERQARIIEIIEG